MRKSSRSYYRSPQFISLIVAIIYLFCFSYWLVTVLLDETDSPSNQNTIIAPFYEVDQYLYDLHKLEAVDNQRRRQQQQQLLPLPLKQGQKVEKSSTSSTFIEESNSTVALPPSFLAMFPVVVESPYQENKSDKNMRNRSLTKKPWFILHVGPQKTMSSSMQCTLKQYQSQLAQDNYIFLGKVDIRACDMEGMKIGSISLPFEDDSCVTQLVHAVTETNLTNATTRATITMDQEQLVLKVPCWNQFSTALDEYARTQTNLIVSDEKFSERHLQQWPVSTANIIWTLIKQRLERQWNIRVIVVYRRYYEWLASVKNQGDKYSLGRRGMKLWEGPEKEPIFTQLNRWIHNTSEIPSPYTPEVYHYYATTLQLDTIVLNMHDSTVDLLEAWVCFAIPNATTTCTTYQQDKKNENDEARQQQKQQQQRRTNPSQIPSYDQIAYAAWQRGLIRDLRGFRKGADRMFYTEMLGRHQQIHKNLSTMDLPRSCPSPWDILPFLRLSQLYEQKFLPTFAQSSLGLETLEESFWKDAVYKKFFCTVNVTTMLADPEWKQFLFEIWDPRAGIMPQDWKNSTYKITSANFTSSTTRRAKRKKNNLKLFAD